MAGLFVLTTRKGFAATTLQLLALLFVLVLAAACGSAPARLTDLAALSEVTPNPINLSARSGAVATASFTFENLGVGSVSYEVTPAAAWLAVADGRTGELAPNETAAVQLQAACPAEAGSFSTTLAVTSVQRGDVARTAAVNLSCTPSDEAAPAPDGTTPATPATPTQPGNDAGGDTGGSDGGSAGDGSSGQEGDESEAVGISNPTPNPVMMAAQVGQSVRSSFSFHNIGDNNLAYAATTSTGWLSLVSGASATLAPDAMATVILQAQCPSTAGTLQTTVAVAFAGQNKLVTVSLACSQEAPITAPAMGEPSPNPVFLAARPNGSTSGTFSFQNLGNADLNYTISKTANWLILGSGAAGELVANATAAVQLQATCPNREEVLNTTVTISSNDPQQPNKQLTVQLDCSNTIRINAGGPGVFAGGITWGNDQFFTGGRARLTATTQDIANTSDDALYHSERMSLPRKSFGYAVPVSNGSYVVRLHFVETHWSASNRRVFSVNLEGQAVLRNYDIHAEVGAMSAAVKCFEVKVADGVLNLDFVARKGRAQVAAIEVRPASGASCR